MELLVDRGACQLSEGFMGRTLAAEWLALGD
jgi:hypothetical protein